MEILWKRWKKKGNRSKLIAALIAMALVLLFKGMVGTDFVQKALFGRLDRKLPATIHMISCYEYDPGGASWEMTCHYLGKNKEPLASKTVNMPIWLGKNIGELDLLRDGVDSHRTLYLFDSDSDGKRIEHWSMFEVFFLYVMVDRIADSVLSIPNT